MPVPPPGIPGPFSLDDAREVGALLSDAGLADVLVSEVAAPMSTGSFDEWWTRMSSLAGPLARMLASLPDDDKEALRGRLLDAVRSYETPTGFEFPGVSLLATGHR